LRGPSLFHHPVHHLYNVAFKEIPQRELRVYPFTAIIDIIPVQVAFKEIPQRELRVVLLTLPPSTIKEKLHSKKSHKGN
jgi:hypothetical protein